VPKPFSIVLALAIVRPVAAQSPLFVGAWMGGPLDSIYNAEYQRVQTACRGAGDACYEAELDTTAVRLAPVWARPDAPEPSGWLTVRLLPRGAWPYAALFFVGADGTEVALIDDLGDWGYGTTLDVAEARDGWLRPWMLEKAGGYWLASDSAPGFGVVEGPFGLEGRLWRMGPVTTATGEELPRGVYMVTGTSDDVVQLREELPTDMECGDPVDPASVPTPAAYEVPLAQLLGPEGRPRVEVAYPKGC
jgi:hypothetical protein